jgi:SAM-dependent methyltransferase
MKTPAKSKIPNPILDACCGHPTFWFAKNDPRAMFVDARRDIHVFADKFSAEGSRRIVISGDFQSDSTALPFADNSFAFVVFDPPPLVRHGKRGWLAKKYGKLEGDWKAQLKRGFNECFRVLRADGVLVFKWSEVDVPVSEIVALSPSPPLFGNRCGRAAKTHWIVFIKPRGDRSAP